ncbi:hypothetical protein JW964_02385, partial [candidate division KSB1 bacterium]|nr:hypothetical protein [candidate division KSB1 bacterium]
MKKLFLSFLIMIIAFPVYSQKLPKIRWQLEDQAPFKGLGGNGVSTMISVDMADSTIIWAGTGRRLSRIKVGTDSWVNYGREHGFGPGGVSALDVDGDIIWAATVFDSLINEEYIQCGGGLVYSLNGGKNWKYIPQPIFNPPQNTTWDLAIDDTTVWITSWGGGLSKSTDWLTDDWLNEDFQPSWISVTPDEYNFDPHEYLNHTPFSVIAVDGIIWVGTAEGVNKSIDGGKNWVNFNHQNQEQPISGNWVITLNYQKVGGKTIIWAGTMETTSETEDTTEFRGISKSEDQGLTWQTYMKGERVNGFAFDGDIVYACTHSGFYKSVDGGENWVKFPQIIDSVTKEAVYTEEYYSAVVTSPGRIWVGSADGLARTEDDGLNWKIFRAFEATGKSGQPRTYAYPNPFSPLRYNQIEGDGYVRF